MILAWCLGAVLLTGCESTVVTDAARDSFASFLTTLFSTAVDNAIRPE